MGSVWAFILLWGVWLITPILVDGVDTVRRLILVRRARKVGTDHEHLDDEQLPSVTVIVPAHNEASVIDRCLQSVKVQDYPADKLEVIVIDDGSTDGTADLAQAHADGTHPSTGTIIRGERIKVGPFNGRFVVIRNGHAGKAHALNTGIQASSGEILINIDSDVVLEPQCIRAIAEAFTRCPDMAAATGNIEIDWDLLEERDREGNLVLDDEGLPTPRRLSVTELFLAESQFLEYLSSFSLGRAAQSETGSMYTLAGACSAFRRSEFEKCGLYSNRTVSEDTDITWALHRAGAKIGFVDAARVFLEPVTELDALYGQRVRWARGQLEVAALNSNLIEGAKPDAGRKELPKMLLMDHTLAFPRLVWTPLVLFFPLLGYSPWLIAIAILAMFVFYVLLELINTFAVFTIAEEDTRHRIERAAWTIAGLPVFRFMVFHFRFSGFLTALTEDQQWTVTGDFDRTLQRLDIARLRTVQMAGLLLRTATHLGSLVLTAVVQLAAPMLIGIALVVGQAIVALQRRSS